MSSFVRRIARQVVESVPCHWNPETKRYESAPPRRKFFGGRGSKLGHTNQKAADKLAREKREASRALLIERERGE